MSTLVSSREKSTDRRSMLVNPSVQFVRSLLELALQYPASSSLTSLTLLSRGGMILWYVLHFVLSPFLSSITVSKSPYLNLSFIISPHNQTSQPVRLL